MPKPKDPYLSGSYDFELDDSFIAKEPINPRNHAKLLVFDRKSGTLTHARFYDLEHFLPQNTQILFNNTKVFKARLFGKKSSGGAIELLINRPLEPKSFQVLIRGKVHEKSQLFFQNKLKAEVVKLFEDGSREVRFFHNETLLDFQSLEPILKEIGHLPLPPYMQRADTKEDERHYQSVFAQNTGAVAAPTASLHFSEAQFQAITKRFAHAYITLHVGAGTFKPVEVEDIRAHPMHSEFYTISKEAQKLIENDKPLLAVGTTVTRTIEYYVRHKQTEGEANLFLHPNNPPQRVNHLLTNFHLPKSTLIMLVASFIGIDKTLELYEIAKQEQYRFYSYGDAMLIV